MRCWITPGADSTDSRARATRSKHPPSTHSARALHVHTPRKMARDSSLPCSLGSAWPPTGCWMAWTLPNDPCEQGWAIVGKWRCLARPSHIPKIDRTKIPILFVHEYHDLPRSPTRGRLRRDDSACACVLWHPKDAFGTIDQRADPLRGRAGTLIYQNPDRGSTCTLR